MSPSPSSSTTAVAAGVNIPQDIIEVNILSKLDGPTLATAACVSTRLHSLAVDETLWENICRSTWPSTTHPLVTDFISTSTSGYRSFFPTAFSTLPFPRLPRLDRPYVYRSSDTRDLISAVDISYNNKAVYSNLQVTDTWTEEYRCRPVCIDGIPQTTAVAAVDEKLTFTVDKTDSISQIAEKLRLSWIVIDPIAEQAVNLSSSTPVLVKKHWIIKRNEVKLQFSTLMANDRCGTGEFRITVKCCRGGCGGGKLVVTDVNLQVLNADGIGLTGRDGLEVIQEALDRGRNIGNEGDGYDYHEFMKMRREKRLKDELDRLGLGILGIIFFIFIFIAAIFWVPFYFFQTLVIEKIDGWIAVKVQRLLPPTGPIISSSNGLPHDFETTTKYWNR